MNEKLKQHEEKMKALKKHFKKLKLIAILLCVAFNIVVDTVVIIFASVEVKIFAILVTLWLSCMFLFTHLRKLNRIKFTQESLLMEETPLGKMKF